MLLRRALTAGLVGAAWLLGALPALAGEVRNAAPEVKAAFDAGLENLAERIGALENAGGRKAALRLLGEMAGVLAISRTISDPRRSNDLLASARKGALAS